MPESVTFTEEQFLAKVNEAVKTEVAEAASKVTTAEAALAVAEAAKAAAEDRAAAAEKALADYQAEIAAAATRTERAAERAAAVKAVAPFLTEGFLGEKAEAWADLDEAAFETVLAIYGEAAKAAPHPFAAATEDAAETACATCGQDETLALHVKPSTEVAAEATVVETAAFKGGVTPQAPSASKSAARQYRDLLRSRSI